MKTIYASSFVKDLKRLRGTSAFERIKMLAFDTIPQAITLAELPNLK